MLDSNVEKNQFEENVKQKLEAARSPDIIGKLRAFQDHLSIYPYLGLGDLPNTGLEIRNAIQKWPVTTIGNKGVWPWRTYWYRARKISEEGRLYTSQEMVAPDPKTTLIPEGRYNHTGQSVMYLSSTKETAVREIRIKDEYLCAIQKFRVHQEIRVLYLRNVFSSIEQREMEKMDESNLLAIAIIYNGFLELAPEVKTSWKPEYLVPRFIADCARYEGYEAIWFSSAVHYGDNLVVFPQKHCAFVTEGPCEGFVCREGKLHKL